MLKMPAAEDRPQNSQSITPWRPQEIPNDNCDQWVQRVDCNSYDLRKAVKLPHSENPNEWMAYNIDFMHKQLCMLYGTIDDICRQECPEMKAGDREYRWLCGANTTVRYNAYQYITHLLRWVQAQLEDNDIFPCSAGKEFPPNFETICKDICRRLIRVYAHCYHHHYLKMKELQEDKIFNTTLKHFVYFTREFNLLEPEDLSPLREHIETFL